VADRASDVGGWKQEAKKRRSEEAKNATILAEPRQGREKLAHSVSCGNGTRWWIAPEGRKNHHLLRPCGAFFGYRRYN